MTALEVALGVGFALCIALLVYLAVREDVAAEERDEAEKRCEQAEQAALDLAGMLLLRFGQWDTAIHPQEYQNYLDSKYRTLVRRDDDGWLHVSVKEEA